MDTGWQETFRSRMRHFESRRAPLPGEVAVSIKVRITSGCFHREHSPRAYELIDRSLQKLRTGDVSFAFEEHESGPELLAYIVTGVGLATAVINLIVAIIKARSEGIRKGDHPSHPLELIVRRVHAADEFREETVLRIDHTDPVDAARIEKLLEASLQKLLKGEKQKTPETKRSSPIKRTRKRR